MSSLVAVVVITWCFMHRDQNISFLSTVNIGGILLKEVSLLGTVVSLVSKKRNYRLHTTTTSVLAFPCCTHNPFKCRSRVVRARVARGTRSNEGSEILLASCDTTFSDFFSFFYSPAPLAYNIKIYLDGSNPSDHRPLSTHSARAPFSIDPKN